MALRMIIAPTVLALECATKKHVDSKRDEYGNCRHSDGCRQLRGPTRPQEQPDTGNNVGKASNEVEPKNERNDVADGGSFFGATKQSFPPTITVTMPNMVAIRASTTAQRGRRRSGWFMVGRVISLETLL